MTVSGGVKSEFINFLRYFLVSKEGTEYGVPSTLGSFGSFAAVGTRNDFK